jgi:hypothetical protein
MEITVTATTTTEKNSMVSLETHVPIFYVLGHRRPEPRGFIGNSSRIRISGCRQ